MSFDQPTERIATAGSERVSDSEFCRSNRRQLAGYAIANPPYFSCGLGDPLWSSLLHGTHVEVEQTLALIARFLVLLSQVDALLAQWVAGDYISGSEMRVSIFTCGPARLKIGSQKA
jgi:hypothetical protein